MNVGIVSGIAGGILAGGLAVYFKGRTMDKEIKGQRKENGSIVLSEGGMWKVSTYTSAAAGILMLIASVVLAFADGDGLEGTLIALVLGTFFIIMSIFTYYYDKINRIEYNEKEITQYFMCKKSRKMKWDEINKIEFKNYGPLFILYSGEKKIILMAKLKGFTQCIEFILQRVDANITAEMAEIHKGISK